MGFLRPLGLASLLVASVRATVSSKGYTVSVSDVDYFLPPKPVAKISGCDGLESMFGNGLFVPFTVVKANGTQDVAALTASYTEDDVWQEGFLEAIWVEGHSKPANISTKVLTGTASGKLPTGPYFINSAGQVFEAWRLFSDIQGAFTESSIANGDGSYSVLSAGAPGQKHAIAVPSRLYFTKTAAKPLAGVRVGIKDIYDIKGLRTSNGNRAWYWLYPPANATAPPVQRLIDAGAIIVGKLITSQFANGETATADWVDFHEAFNPRGDGYQDTSSSSSGAGAGTAAYSWLDVSMGSDTGGSIRNPSQVQGIYGNRPSHGLVPLDHVMPLSPLLDTSGLLARDPLVWRDAAAVIYETNITFTKNYPTSIKTLSWPTSADSVADKILIEFLGNVTAFLKANTSAYNLSASFVEDNPTLPSLIEVMNLTYTTLITKQQIPLVRTPFFADYAAKHDGRKPFIDPIPTARWGWADNTTVTLDEAIANKTIFMSWANSTFLAPSDQTCSENIVMYVGSAATTAYRNRYLALPSTRLPFGWSDDDVTIFSEVPDMVVPVGEAPYNSTITDHVEYLPVSVDFLAAKGCDGMLFELIGDLYEAGILKKSLPGQSGITGGEILLKRDMPVY